MLDNKFNYTGKGKITIEMEGAGKTVIDFDGNSSVEYPDGSSIMLQGNKPCYVNYKGNVINFISRSEDENEIKKIIDSAIEDIIESRLHNPTVQAVHQSSKRMQLTDLQELYFLASELIKDNQRVRELLLEKAIHEPPNTL